jgi:hypothetical protein
MFDEENPSTEGGETTPVNQDGFPTSLFQRPPITKTKILRLVDLCIQTIINDLDKCILSFLFQ